MSNRCVHIPTIFSILCTAMIYIYNIYIHIYCYMGRFRFNNTLPSSERGPRFLIVGRKRVSAYDLWQCPCYRLWQKNIHVHMHEH